MTNITDLKETAEDLEELLAFYKAAGKVEPVAELAAMLARVQDAISQFEEAHGLLFDAEDLLEKYAPPWPEADEIDTDITPY